jgi:hypothetical protein
VVSRPSAGSRTLQQNGNLAVPPDWTTSGYTFTTADGTNSITITPPAGNLFFRLERQAKNVKPSKTRPPTMKTNTTNTNKIMNTTTIRLLLFLLLFSAASLSPPSLFAQGTAFTYQGRLQTNGTPANGSYDMTFSLYNVSSGGSVVAGPLTQSGIKVTNGLFTVALDYGPGVFTGTAYWLQIGVRSNGVGSYNALSPRQELTPTPYAITAENVDGLVPASQLSGMVPPGALSGVNGSGLVDLNASQLTSGTVPHAALPADVAFLDANQSFTGINTFTGPGESFIINTGPISTSLFTGLSLQYYPSTGEGAIMSAYNDGYGFLTFYTKQGSGYPIVRQMMIDKYGGVAIDQQNYNNGVLNNGTTNGVGLTFGVTSGEGIASQRTAGIDQYSLEFYTSFNNRMTILNDGNVGINTTNPAAQLDVESASTVSSANAVYGVISSTSPGGSSAGVRGQNNGTGGLGIGVYGSQNGSGWGVYGTTPAGLGVYGYSSSGTGVYGESSSGTGLYAYSGSGSALTIGNGAFHVSGATTNSTTTTAFTQVATAGNVVGDYTIINNTLCNGDRNAILIVTPNWNPAGGPAYYWNHTVGVYYTGANWAIFNEDGTTMPAGPAFNVLIIKN